MEKLQDKNVILPQDFVQFIRRNYERIQEIEMKVEQFENDPWNGNSLRYRNFRNLQFYKLFESVDSCFSEADVGKVISASIKPKLERLDDAEDRIQVGDEYLENIKQGDSFEPDSEIYDTIIKNFPLITISKLIPGNENDIKIEESYPSSFLLVQGVPLTFSERQIIAHSCNKTPKASKRLHRKNPKKKICKGVKNVEEQECSTRFLKPLSIKIPISKSKGSWTSDEEEISCEEVIKKAKQFKEDNSVTNNLQLTLPPLHSSVLTLLGQRSGPKPSPRNLLSLAQEASISSGATSRNKKLRRHGRNRNKNPSKVKAEEGNAEDRAGSEEVKKTATDEPHETEVSTFPNSDVTGLVDGPMDVLFNGSVKTLQKFSESRRALYHVLDDHLAGKPWNPKEMSNLDEEIGQLVEHFRKDQTKFKTNLIQMKEDYWLSFPRTWSRSSATFGVPYDTRSLKGMTSLEYLEKFVTISEPRRHLYSLIFQRHRMITNPTGKFIHLKVCKQALMEVLGRSFLEEEMMQLSKDYLGCDDGDLPVLEKQFHGICAFCERIYGCYSLEEHHECHTCCNTLTKDKERCHQNQKSQLEKTDLSYLSIKIRDNQVEHHLSNLLKAVIDRD